MDYRALRHNAALGASSPAVDALRHGSPHPSTVLSFGGVPKGFFPVQDTGLILAISESRETISFSAMANRQLALAKVILQDPDVASLSSFIGIDGTNTTANSGRMLIN